jgi:glycerophosphoryl diester phosphodiesterase
MTRPRQTTEWIIAHRGASRDRPENTLAAFDEALLQGCDGLELDVQLARDGVPVVYHDRTLAKLGAARRRVDQLDLRDLRRLDAGAWLDARFRGLHIPTLEEVLENYGSRTRLLVELKTRGPASDRRRLDLVRSVLALVQRGGAERNVMLLSFDATLLELCAREGPEIARVLNVQPPPLLPPRVGRGMSALAAVCVDVRFLTPAVASAVRRAGRPLLVFTCNRCSHVERARAAGAMGILTDRPAWLAEVLGRSRQADAT